MSHLEDLIAEFYDWRGYLVKRNIKVGKLSHGGYQGELDIVAYDPHTSHLIHIEPSLDSHPWSKREERFAKKFKAGEEHIFSEVFTWLGKETEIEQVAILPSSGKDKSHLAGAKLLSIDEFMREVIKAIRNEKPLRKGAISEQYPLLRTIQLCLNGYSKSPIS